MATVTVRINDINDNTPVFEASHQRVRVGEDSPLGTVVARVPATDMDSVSLLEPVLLDFESLRMIN